MSSKPIIENNQLFESSPFRSDSVMLTSQSETVLVTNKIKLDDSDFRILKESLLFTNWNDNSLKNFIDDERVILKKYKYFPRIIPPIYLKLNLKE